MIDGISSPAHSYFHQTWQVFWGFPSKPWMTEGDNMTNPRWSMYGIFTYIDPINDPNVGKYTIHGWSGNGSNGFQWYDPVILSNISLPSAESWQRTTPMSHPLFAHQESINLASKMLKDTELSWLFTIDGGSNRWLCRGFHKISMAILHRLSID